MTNMSEPASHMAALIGRRAGGFAVDARFGAAEGAAATPAPLGVAWSEGYQQGLHDAQAAAAGDAQVLARLGPAFARLDAELAEQLRARLIATVAALCETALAPLALDRDALTERVARAAALFVRADDARVIRLNPADLAAIRERLPADWEFRPDPTLAPGALRIETQDGGAEDGPSQWREAIARALDPSGPG